MGCFLESMKAAFFFYFLDKVAFFFFFKEHTGITGRKKREHKTMKHAGAWYVHTEEKKVGFFGKGEREQKG